MFRNDVVLPEVLVEKPPCQRETLTATTELPLEMSAMDAVPQEVPLATAELPTEVLPAVPSVVPPAEAGKDPGGIELPPCAGKSGTCPGEEPPMAVPVLPASLETTVEQPLRSVPRGTCLMHNWQEERATNHLDTVPGREPINEGFTYRHGHPGLLTHELISWPTHSTTTKDTYRPPHSVLLLGLGQRKAMLENMLYQKYRKEMLEKICPPRKPMELISTTHRDYGAKGCQFTPPPSSQPHNYFTEQPRSFWLEQAHSLPGVTGIRSGDSPFQRNAAFTTPVTEYLEQPLPSTPLSSRFMQ
ncbi:PREDICTED: sperm-associated antigen 8 [Calidris pugnax]|uniref:sperm-associated antigen 8 n=1 Tax=Calidris pugnax TaxID=198806 RepID=UPI00071E0B3F|nr:PREDICTED: sperm-associated antigen 8 [Calidris pugnax]